MKQGTLIQVTAEGQQGTLEGVGFSRFAKETVTKGDRGEYWGTHPELPGWHMIAFEINGETRYCPLAEGAFAEWHPNRKSDAGTDSLASLLP